MTGGEPCRCSSTLRATQAYLFENMAEAEAAPPSSVSFKGATFKPLVSAELNTLLLAIRRGPAVQADGNYDVIILGTGLKECILSGLLSVKGKKVRSTGVRAITCDADFLAHRSCISIATAITVASALH